MLMYSLILSAMADTAETRLDMVEHGSLLADTQGPGFAVDFEGENWVWTRL